MEDCSMEKCPFNGATFNQCKVEKDCPYYARTGKWEHGVCNRCGYDWSKVAPIANVPNFCPGCGTRMT